MRQHHIPLDAIPHGELPASLQCIPGAEHEAHNVQAALCAEVAERLLELGDGHGWARVHLWLTRMANIGGSPSALRLYLSLQSGDTAAVGSSLSDRGSKRGVSKQAIHDRQQNDLAHIARFAPDLAREIAIATNCVALLKRIAPHAYAKKKTWAEREKEKANAKKTGAKKTKVLNRTPGKESI